MQFCEPFLSSAPNANFGAPYGAPCTPVEERWARPRKGREQNQRTLTQQS